MTEFEILKAKYNDIVSYALEKNKRILIDSFVEYYGEEYRSIIESKYSEITFISFLDWERMHILLNQFGNEISSDEQYQDIRMFIKANKKENSFLKKWFSKNDENRLPSYFIGSTNPEILNIYNIKRSILDILANVKHPYNSNYSLEKDYRIIFLPIFTLNERAIIHEINHALVCEFMGRIVDAKGKVKKIYKSGMETSITAERGKEDILEELINDKASFEILSIFKRRGGDLSSFCIMPPIPYAYEKNFYLVNDFYKLFKEYLKKARMTLNKNELIARVGEETYIKYTNLVRYSYHSNLDMIPKTQKTVLPMIQELIENMKNHSAQFEKLTRAELEDFYNKLRALGHSVKILNDYNPEEHNIETQFKR